jgi:hypothetical protein
MFKYIVYFISLILALLAALIVVLCVLLLESVVTLTTKSKNLFKRIKYGKHRVPEGTNTCLWVWWCRW